MMFEVQVENYFMRYSAFLLFNHKGYSDGVLTIVSALELNSYPWILNLYQTKLNTLISPPYEDKEFRLFLLKCMILRLNLSVEIDVEDDIDTYSDIVICQVYLCQGLIHEVRI